jgi:iron complex transport system ATP-binding protein
VIEARGVTVRAGAAVLVDGVDLDVAAGEVLALVGPNGAGKSTLLSALSGDRTLAAGRVAIGGVDVVAAAAARLAALRAVLPQASSLAAAFTALEVVMLGQQGGGDERVRRVRALRRLDEVELARLAGRSYPSLSGGEKQRVQLARVLEQLGDAGGRALFLDEPTAALDPRHQHVVLSLARRAASRGHAVVAVLHDLSLASCWADRVALLHRGALVACGPPADVLEPAQLRRVFDVDFTRVAHPSGRGALIASMPSTSPGPSQRAGTAS